MKKYFFLGICVSLFISACGNGDSPDVGDRDLSVLPDTLYIDQFSEVITTESGLLATPVGIVPVGDDNFAILDANLHRVLVFDKSGDKMFEFGGSGSGPGEWEMFPSGLNYTDNTFMVFNSGRFFFNLYDTEGDFISSSPASRFMSVSNFRLLPDKKLLVNTSGREDALAIVIDLSNESEIIERIGTPTGEIGDMRDIESERLALAEGTLKPYHKNTAIVESGDGGYWLFMNGLGELRFYDAEGELKLSKSIPKSIKEPIFDMVVRRNRDDARPHTVFNLSYALVFKKFGDKLYILTTAYPEEDDIHQNLLVYTTDGDLVQRYVIKRDENESMLYDFFITADNELVALEVMNSRVLKTNL